MTAWTFTPTEGVARLRAELASKGYALVRIADAPRDAAAAPWAFAERLFGESPRMVERQPIRPVTGGRSFASTDVFTPLHTDSQLHLGAPAGAQVMACERAASAGGESHLIDAWALCETIAQSAPSLFEALVRTPRRVPFVFGDVWGPTLALRAGMLTFTHSPMAPSDSVATALAPWIERAPRITVPVRAGDTLVLDNHRMLHGRAAFRDPGRSFVRLLVWLPSPLGAHPALHAVATREVSAREASLGGASVVTRSRHGFAPAVDAESSRRLRVVLEMLRGTPPGVLAAREGVAESELYAWRDAAIDGAARALAER